MRSTLAILALAAVATAAVFAQPAIFLVNGMPSAVQNNYSGIRPGMPNYGIAQGSIFDIYGANLATVTSPLQSIPLPTAVNGTSVNVTVNGTTTHAILYFVSPGQIAAILPSATPVGTGQITVTVSGKSSSPGTIKVVQSAFGMLTLNGIGSGPAAVFDLNSNYLGLTNAANPGDFITLWGSGVGPVTGDESVAQTPVNLTNIPIEVDIGGKAALVQYAGRSTYPGLDQINVQVPAGLSGCHVSVVVRSGDIVSNFGTIPVAPSGRVCAEPVAGMTANEIQSLMSRTVINRGGLEFDAGVATIGTGAFASFGRFTKDQFAAKQPGANVSFGDCIVYNYRNVNFGLGNPIQPTPLDAGPSIRVSTPVVGTISIPFQDGSYAVTDLMANGSFRGTYTFTGSGGPDVGAFSAQVDWPGGGSGFTFSTTNNATSVTRSQGLTVSWSQPNPDPNEYIQVFGFSFVPGYPFGAEFICNVPIAAGRFTIPPAVLLALPVQPSGAPPAAVLEVDAVVSHEFTAPGVDSGNISFVFGNSEPFYYQ